MGTRGAWGLRHGNVDKLTYNHFDSYPDGLGQTIIKAVQDYPDAALARTFKRLVVIDGDTPPTPAEQERYADVANLHVSNQSMSDWYCLLRNAQGEPDLYIDGMYDHMYDGNTFVYDSLFCEWAYIINLDTNTVEVYKGFNKDPELPGRYASRTSPGGYCGVGLLAELTFDEIRSMTDKDLTRAITALQAASEDEEDDD